VQNLTDAVMCKEHPHGVTEAGNVNNWIIYFIKTETKNSVLLTSCRV